MQPKTHLPLAPGARRLLPLLLVGWLFASGARAQETDYYVLPGADTSVTADAVTIRYGAFHETYVPGLGWLSGIDADAPLLRNGTVLLSGDFLEELGVDLPRLAGVRYSGDAEVRVVLDVPQLNASQLAELRSSGQVNAGESLTLSLPPLLLPEGQPEEVAGVLVEVRGGATSGATELVISGPDFSYDAFPLANPTRLVLDIRPHRDLSAVTQLERTLAPGVTYRRFKASSASGPSVVHLVSIEPGAGELRVVGESRVARTTTELAQGAVVALNAGYFDTATFAAIGYLLVDGGLLSLPSRHRASFGIAPGQPPFIDRLDVTVSLTGPRGRVEVGSTTHDGVDVVRTAGAFAGDGRRGVLLVVDGVVRENKIGPRLVPSGGYALVYPPQNRELALLDEGDRVSLTTTIEPSHFGRARYAVEAGPLLVKDGRPAFEPELERFATGQRILDGLTQQAAVGVTPSGTTLLLVAETMRAADLVPLFLDLGVDSAMRLDSGGSSTLVIEGRPVNRSSERRVVSAIVLVSSRASN